MTSCSPKKAPAAASTPLSARTATALDAATVRLADRLSHADLSLADVAFTLHRRAIAHVRISSDEVRGTG